MTVHASLRDQHVCVISTVHGVDDVRVNTKMVQSFLAAGARVTWVGPELAAFDNAYRDPRVTYHLTRRSSSVVGRVWSLRRLARAARLVANVDWFYAPTPDAARIAQRTATRSNARVLFDLLEAYHKGLLDRHLRGRDIQWMRQLVKRWIVQTCERSDLVSTVSQGVLNHYRSPRATYVLVRSCAPMSFSGQSSSAEYRTESVRAMHGKFSPINGTDVVLEALSRIPNHIDCHVLMFGEAGLRQGYETLGSALELAPPVPHQQMADVMRTCNVGLVAYPRNLGTESLPNRLFEYMAAGLAIIAPDYSPEIREIIATEECGFCIDTEDPQAIADALVWCAANPEAIRLMGERARSAFALRHNWEREFRELVGAMHVVHERQRVSNDEEV